MVTREKNDVEQLRGILSQFSPDVIREAMQDYDDSAEVSKGAHLRKSYKDFPDPGPEVPVEASAAVVELDEVFDIERIIGVNNLLPVHFLEEGAVVQRAVARVTLKQAYSGLPAGSGWATGFMVSPSLFLTNNHVIPDKAFAAKVEAQFLYQYDYLGNLQAVDAYQFDPDSVFRTNATLDYTLIRMKKRCRLDLLRPADTLITNGEAPTVIDPGGLRPIDPIIPPPRIWWLCRHAGDVHGYIQLRDSLSYAVNQHLNIIQHPSGRHKEVALQQNQITNIYTNHIRYTTDTEPGSSGSPVFNNAWDLVTLHHAGGEFSGGVWINNQGVRIDKIVADMRAHFGAGHSVLTELGL